MFRNKARPKSRKKGPQTGVQAEAKMHRLLKDIAEFEDFQTILQSIRKDLKNGMTESQLAKKYAPLAQARIISDMLTTDNPQAALAAARDVLDRVNGKAVEKKETTHKFQDLKDEELDAVLRSEIEDLEDMEGRFEQ